jgi:hypothetical protein
MEDRGERRAGLPVVPPMAQDRDRAMAEFKKAMTWIAAIGVFLVVAVLAYLASIGELYTHMVVATVAGVFVSVLLGCGLFALAFFSDKSGHDQNVTDATERKDRGPPADPFDR